ncbi:MAG: porin family protein [Roseovarius sp.]|nr:porin family protein [Roseovarius sp.]
MQTPLLPLVTAIAAGLMALGTPVLAETSKPAPEPAFEKPTLMQFAPSTLAGAPTTLSSQGSATLGSSANWTGFYGGVQAGIGFVDTNRSGNDEDIMGGFTLGYDHDFGQWVLGGALDYDFADIDAGPNNAIENIFRIKGRAGYKIDRGLFYGTGGYAIADTDTAGRDDGWFLGGGYEFMVSDQFSVGTEVLYHEFDSVNNSGTDIEATTLQIRAIYRF